MPGVQEWRHGHVRHAGPGRGRRMDRGLHLRRRPAGRLGRDRRAGPADGSRLPAPRAGRAPGGRVVRAAGGPGRGPDGGGPGLGRGRRHGRHRWPAPASSTSPGARRCTCAPCSRGPPSSRRSCRPSPAGPWWPGPGPAPWCSPTPWSTPAAARSTLGLGLVDNLTVVPHFGDEHDDAHGQKLERTVAMAPAALPVVALPARTALIRDGDGCLALRGGGDAGRLRRRRADRGARRAQELRPGAGQSFSSMVTLSITTRSVGVPERLPDVVDRLDHVEPAHDLAEVRVERRQAAPRRDR